MEGAVYMGALKKDVYSTYADYALWEEPERYELIDGVPYAMAAPSWTHQDISMSLSWRFRSFLQGKRCKVYAAPVDVCLNGLGDNDDTVVQPDLIIVCDRSRLKGGPLNGVPDMAIEILSPSSTRMDLDIKFEKYREAGVKEYWTVDPVSKTVRVNILKNGKYISKIYRDGDLAPVFTLPGLEINLHDVFAEAE
jgi:Uma2 family endonuclease